MLDECDVAATFIVQGILNWVPIFSLIIDACIIILGLTLPESLLQRSSWFLQILFGF